MQNIWPPCSINCLMSSLLVFLWFWLFLRKDMVYRWATEYPPEDHKAQACEYSRRQSHQSIYCTSASSLIPPIREAEHKRWVLDACWLLDLLEDSSCRRPSGIWDIASSANANHHFFHRIRRTCTAFVIHLCSKFILRNLH